MRASHDHQQGRTAGRGGAASTPASSPGKRTLTEGLGAGEALPDAQRAQFEKSLGRDLSGVRVHTDDAAAENADRVNARAYATGHDIVFGKGEHAPHDARSRHLLAHEVAHVAQQQGAAPSGELATTQPGDAAERNADAAAAAMLAGRPASVSTQPASIARKTRDESVEPASPSEPAAANRPDGAPAGSSTKGDDEGEIGELSAERIGLQLDEGEDVGPDVPVRDVEGGKQEIAGAGHRLPPEGAEGGAAGGSQPAGADAAPAGGGASAGDAGGGAVSEEVSAAVVEAQSDTREAITQSEAESAAYKAEMTEQRERFEAEQHARMLEELKTMSPVEKRQTLQEMGYDPKKVKKLKDAELDALIEGKMEAEQRKTKILGMTPEELAALSPGQKTQYLVDLGIDRKDLDKAGQGKTTQLFDDIMKVAHVPGQHKVKIKIKGGLLGKSWEVTVKCDAEGAADIQAEAKGGFLSRLWGWVKLALPIVLGVIGPVTAGASLIVLAVYQTVTAIKSGNWLGAIIGAAGALVGVGAVFAAAKSVSTAATTFSKIADVANKVKKVAEAAQAAMQAAKAKNAGALLGALAQGAAVFAGTSGKAAGKFAETMKKWAERLEKWSKIISGGQKVVQAIQKGDPLAAIGSAFDTAVTVVGAKTSTGKALSRASKITGFVNAGKQALGAKPPNYPAVAEAALGIAGQLHEDRRIDDASRIISRATTLKQAWDKRDSNPGALIDAALGLAEAIQLAKYDLAHDEQKDGDGNPEADAERTAITTRYERAGRIVKSASAVLEAATARPPSYTAALDAATQLIAELTDSKQIDAAAVVTAKLDAWTKAVNSKDDMAILQAGVALGQAIDGLRTVIGEEHDKAKREAEAKLGPGEKLPDNGGSHLPPAPSTSPAPPGDPYEDAPHYVRVPSGPGGPHGPMDDADGYVLEPQRRDPIDRTAAEIARDKRDRRPEGGRERARSQLADLESDWAGRLILERYLFGDGDWDIHEAAWQGYMMRSEMLRQQLLPRLKTIARARAASPRAGDRGAQLFTDRFHAEVEDGEGIIGYQYLHGTDANAGGFQFYGTTTVERDVGATNNADGNNVPGETIVEVQANYCWNDFIDPNPKYDTDTIKSVIAEILTLGMANAYRISISWTATARVHLDPSGRITQIEGWPGERQR